MAKDEFKKEWLDAALAQCAAEMSTMLKSEAALAKSATDDAPAEESTGDEGPASPPPADDSAGPPDEASAPAEGPPAEASAPDDGVAPDAAGAPPPGADDGMGQEAIQPAPTVEALQAEYQKLDPEALKMHYLAAKGALAAAMGAAQGAAPEASAPGAGAPPMAPPPAAGPPPGAAPMAMGELGAGKKVNLSDGSGGEIEKGKMAKAESEINSLRSQLAEQTNAVAKLAQAVEIMTTPIRKSVKGLSDLRFIDRTEETKPSAAKSLTKKEVQAVLSAKVREGKLSKADKELVTQYSVGSVDISKIEHLLAVAK
jgi:hypothetical protein